MGWGRVQVKVCDGDLGRDIMVFVIVKTATPMLLRRIDHLLPQFSATLEMQSQLSLQILFKFLGRKTFWLKKKKFHQRKIVRGGSNSLDISFMWWACNLSYFELSKLIGLHQLRLRDSFWKLLSRPLKMLKDPSNFQKSPSQVLSPDHFSLVVKTQFTLNFI